MIQMEMDMDLIGALVSAGANLFGGAMNQQNQQQINQQNIAAQQAINNQNIAEQEKFAQSGIQWKVADARAAGINPLAALGTNTMSFSNQVAPISQASNQAGAGVASAGQDLGRAIQAMQSPEDKAVAAYKTKMDLESMTLDNDIKRANLASSLAKATQPGQPPGVETVRMPTMAWGPQPGGGYVVSTSKDIQDRNYGAIGEISSGIRNRLVGFADPSAVAPPGVKVPPGEYQTFNPLTGVWNRAPTLGTAYRSGRWRDFFFGDRD